MQGELAAPVGRLFLRKGDIAHHGIDTLGVEVTLLDGFHPNIMAWIELAADTPGKVVLFDTDEGHGGGRNSAEATYAAARFEDRGVVGHTAVLEAQEEGTHEEAGRVEGRVGAAGRTRIVLGRQRGLELRPQGFPPGVFVLTGEGMGEQV